MLISQSYATDMQTNLKNWLAVIRKQEGPKVCIFAPTFTAITPLKMVEIKQSKYLLRKKFTYQAIKIPQKPVPVSSALK